MTDFIIYQGKAAIILAVFYMFYRLLLSKDTFHRFNRIVLLGTAALSFILPLCVITIKEVVILPAVSASTETIVGEATETVAMVPEVSAPIWPVVLSSLFVLGALAVLVHVAISIIGIMRIIGSGSRQTLESGETLIITENDTAPFSWMKYIVISREDYESGYSQILTHEKAHIALRHSWDILFVDMITALQWFNPAIWMLKADLRALHEFEADDAVLRSGANIKEYQYLLIRKAVSKSGYSVANSFNHSTLKARITMMLNKKSSRMSVWKALYVIPLVGISLAATAETKVDYRYEDQQPEATADTLKARVVKVHNTPDGKDSKNSFREKNLSEGRFVIDEEAGSITMIYFDHNGNELKSQIKGMRLNHDIYIHNGNMATPGVVEECLKEEEAVLLTAYLKNGKKVRGVVTPNNNYATGVWDVTKHPDEQETVYHMKGKQYKVRGGKYVEIEEPQKSEEKKVIPFQLVAQKPGFNGGDANEFSKWVSQNLRYPEKCRQSKIEGRVTVQFTVTETGKVNDVTVLRSVNEDLDKEAARVVSQSPLWTPGRDENGEAVSVTYVFPVIFRVPDIQEGNQMETKKVVPFQQVAQKPGFNGGDANEFSKWVGENVVYPESCRQSKVQGRVTVQFTVTEEGKVTDVKVLRGVNAELDKEAVRVISGSPLWTPGRDENGEAVSVSYVFPVIFKI